MYFDPTMTLDEYEDFKLKDEIKIGYEVEEDLPDEYEEDSYIDELKTDGFNAVYDPLDELFGEPIGGYSLYYFNVYRVAIRDPIHYNKSKSTPKDYA